MIDISDLLMFAENFQNLGGAVQKQLSRVIDNPTVIEKGEINPNALQLIKEFLENVVDHFEGEGIGDDAMSILMDIDEMEEGVGQDDMDALGDDEFLVEDVELPEK